MGAMLSRRLRSTGCGCPETTRHTHIYTPPLSQRPSVSTAVRQPVSACPLTAERLSADNFRCEVCGRSYSSRVSLNHHSKMHAGATTCALCGRVCSRVADLRTHLRVVHKLSTDEIRAIVPTREKFHLLNTIQQMAAMPQPRQQ